MVRELPVRVDDIELLTASAFLYPDSMSERAAASSENKHGAQLEST